MPEGDKMEARLRRNAKRRDKKKRGRVKKQAFTFSMFHSYESMLLWQDLSRRESIVHTLNEFLGTAVSQREPVQLQSQFCEILRGSPSRRAIISILQANDPESKRTILLSDWSKMEDHIHCDEILAPVWDELTKKYSSGLLTGTPGKILIPYAVYREMGENGRRYVGNQWVVPSLEEESTRVVHYADFMSKIQQEVQKHFVHAVASKIIPRMRSMHKLVRIQRGNQTDLELISCNTLWNWSNGDKVSIFRRQIRSFLGEFTTLSKDSFAWVPGPSLFYPDRPPSGMDCCCKTPAILEAVKSGKVEMVAFYLAWKDSDLFWKNKSGDTLLHVAVRISVEMTEFILTSPAGIKLLDVPNNAGYTPLMRAVQKNQPAVVAYLLQKGANVFAKNGLGKTAMDYASRGRGSSCTDVLDRAWRTGKPTEEAELVSVSKGQSFFGELPPPK